MHYFACRILFVESTRKEHGAIKTAIEGAEMVDILIFHFYPTQDFIPTMPTLQLKLFHIGTSQFLEILAGLRTADKRRSHTSLNLFSTTAGLEGDDGTHMMGFLLAGSKQFAILHAHESGKVVVELDNKVITEIIWHSSTVAGRITYYPPLGRKHLDAAPLVEGIDYHIRLVGLGKSESHQSCTLRRTQFCRHIIIGKINTIIIRCSRFCLMREPAGTLFFMKHRFANSRHQRKLPVVINPRTGLVGLLQSPYLFSRIRILPSISHLSGLWHPEVHAPRHGYGRIGITGGKPMLGICTHEWINIIHRILHVHPDGLRHQGETQI